MKLKKGKSLLSKKAENKKRKIKNAGIKKQQKVDPTSSSDQKKKKKRSLLNDDDDEEVTKKSKKRNLIKEKSKKKTSLDVKSSNNLEEENTKTIIGKKRKRPWRQAVRNRAKRERLRLLEKDENDDSEEEDDEEEELNEPKKTTNSTITKMIATKKKKMSRVKRLKNKQRLLAQMEGDNEADEEEVKENLLKKNAKSRMDASRFRFINEKLYTQPSTSAVQMFAEDPDAFETYHRGYKEQLKKWPVNPLQTIILDLSTMQKGSVIADLGCGEAELAQKLGHHFRVHSFDLVATNERTTVADMANLPLDTASVDVCVYCLSLMGTNLAHFFREAHRILKEGGKLKIAEVASRFQNVKTFIAALNKMGFQLKRRKEIGDGFFIILTLQKVGKIENKRPLGLHLLPCLYKKR